MCEELLVEQCAPTMAGLKTGSLFSCPKEDRAELLRSIRSLNARLVPRGLRILPVKTVGDRELIYLYRPAKRVSVGSGPPLSRWRKRSGRSPGSRHRWQCRQS